MKLIVKDTEFPSIITASCGLVRRQTALLLGCLAFLCVATSVRADDKKEGLTPDLAQDAQPMEIEVSAAEVAAFFKEAGAVLKGMRHEPGKKPQVLDVRTPEEFEGGHVPGARNADFLDEAFKTQVASLDKSRPYIVHCAAGGRSAKAVSLMKSLGFAKIYHMKEGFAGWQKAKGPVETGKAKP